MTTSRLRFTIYRSVGPCTVEYLGKDGRGVGAQDRSFFLSKEEAMEAARKAGWTTAEVSEQPSDLGPKPQSLYKQLFVKDRWVAARTLYGQTLGDGARTPQQLAADYGLSLDAVREAIAWCESNPPEIREDWEQEEALEAKNLGDSSSARVNPWR